MFTRAIEGKGHSVIYFSPDGRRTIRNGGTWSWRNNNPGNMVKGRKSRSLGSIGVAGGFAVFPNYQTGRNALKGLLQSTYLKFSLFNLVKKYAPPKENDIRRYRKLLRDFTGIDLKRTVGSLTPQEMERLLDAIEKIEGFRHGAETELGPAKQIIDVRRNKKKQIVGYLVEDLGWLSPLATVRGILTGEIDGVVAERGGRTYIRTRPDDRSENNLEIKGRE